jgi:predicted nucleic acid-binding protein
LILPDVNILLYAFRKDAADHARYRDWIEQVLNADAAYGISPRVLAGVIRIATHPRIFKEPSRPEW